MFVVPCCTATHGLGVSVRLIGGVQLQDEVLLHPLNFCSEDYFLNWTEFLRDIHMFTLIVWKVTENCEETHKLRYVLLMFI